MNTNKKNRFSIILSIVAIIMSAAALCVICVRNKELDFDWYGALIGILSLLVAVLICYQIYSAITVEERIDEKTEKALNEAKKEIETTREVLKKEIETQRIEFEGNLSDSTALSLFASKNYKPAFRCGIYAIGCHAKTENHSGVQTSINALKTIISKMEKNNSDFSISKDDKDSFIKTLTDAKNMDAFDIIAFVKDKIKVDYSPDSSDSSDSSDQ